MTESKLGKSFLWDVVKEEYAEEIQMKVYIRDEEQRNDPE
jgi:hypothetical protein